MKSLTAQVASIPDGFFYYGLSVALAGILVYLLVKYSNKIDRTFDRIGETLNALKQQQMVHETKIEAHERDIEHLKSKI